MIEARSLARVATILRNSNQPEALPFGGRQLEAARSSCAVMRFRMACGSPEALALRTERPDQPRISSAKVGKSLAPPSNFFGVFRDLVLRYQLCELVRRDGAAEVEPLNLVA